MKVIVLEARALHLGYLGCYGNEWVATPCLDGLAAEAVVFDQHFADHPHLHGEHRPCFSGRYHFPFPDRDAAIATEKRLSLDLLLERCGIPRLSVTGAGGLESWDRAREGATAALEQLASREHWLLWAELPTVAPPWEVPEDFLLTYFPEEEQQDEEPLVPWADLPAGPLVESGDLAIERLQNTYAAAVSFFDSQVGQLLEELKERGLFNQVMLCFTADRGLALGEHGWVGDCCPWPHEEIIHLPLIVRLPGTTQAGRRVFGLTQPVDLFPTILEALGLPVAETAHGKSLWPLLEGKAEQVRPYVCTGWRVGQAVAWALRTPQWGFILPLDSGPQGSSTGPQLFVKPDDRWEVNNVLQHHLDLAEHLEQTLRAFVEAAHRPGPLQAPELRDIEAGQAGPEPELESEPNKSGAEP
jgi:arylsulfatase A-like enzyme